MANPATTPQPDPLIGTTLAERYEIVECVGQGAMGAVYRAIQTGLGRSVALKVLKQDLTWGGDTVARFHREARAMSALAHPNTVRVFDFGATDSGLLYLAMELLEGQIATDLLRAGGEPPPIRSAVIYAQQVLRSIGEAHAKGIIHRDLKPDNLFLAQVDGEPEPTVKVLDFGIAKAIEGDRKIDQFETQDGTVFGTPRYMSPEQAQGKQLDHRSDLYGVGIILYELLTGFPPFTDADAVIVMAQHIREQPLPVTRAAPERPIPRSLEAVVTKALQKAPDDRFQSADEFERALQACLPDVDRLSRLADSGAHRSVVASLRHLPRSQPSVFWGGAAALLVLAGFAVVMALPRANEVVPEVPERGSAPAPATESRMVRLTSEPEGAQVFRGDTLLGVTPLEVAVAPEEIVAVRLSKPGYAGHTTDLSADDEQRVVKLEQLNWKQEPDPSAGSAPKRTTKPKKAGKRPKQRKPQKSATPAPTEKQVEESPYERF